MANEFNLQLPVVELANGNSLQRQVAIFAGYLDEPKRDHAMRKRTYHLLSDMLSVNGDNPIRHPWGTLSRHVRWDGLAPGIVVNGRIVSISGHPCGPRHPNPEKK